MNNDSKPPRPPKGSRPPNRPSYERVMENLENFWVANNPLRERNFLAMATDDLKSILRSRLAPEEEFETDEFDTEEKGAIESNGVGVASSHLKSRRRPSSRVSSAVSLASK